MSWILIYPESQAEIITKKKKKTDRFSKYPAIYCLRGDIFGFNVEDTLTFMNSTT